MSIPFGFGPNNPPGGSGGGFGFGGLGGGGDDLAGKIPLFAELQKLLSWSGGPVNWDLARQIAISTIAANYRAVTSAEAAEVTDALRLADVWLDAVTDLPSGVTTTAAWTRVEWIEKTLDVWGTLCDPVAERVVASMSAAVPAEAMAAAGPMAGVMTQLGGLMFGAQVGQGLAGMATEVIGSTDVGLPLAAPGTAVLLPENVTAFGEGLELPAEEVRLYLALREAAHQRLFGHVPWLRQQLLETVAAYARGITIDPEALQRAMGEIDPTNPESMQNALNGELFTPADTPGQEAALRRLETLLALVEGWVDSVVAAAAQERMPGAAALRETSRRRRAAGGPAEQTFSTLVGLEMRPRRLREAAALWWAVTEKRGLSARDELWSHPDLLPSADDLDDPLGFAERVGSDPMAELDVPSALTDGTATDQTATDQTASGGPVAGEAATDQPHEPETGADSGDQ
ncbi:putative hydrolase [Frankineae bacterium MT45]|nr:putative hydrolase [Frankineae bacterium MT45]